MIDCVVLPRLVFVRSNVRRTYHGYDRWVTGGDRHAGSTAYSIRESHSINLPPLPPILIFQDRTFTYHGTYMSMFYPLAITLGVSCKWASPRC